METLRDKIAKRVFSFWFTSGLIKWENLLPENQEKVKREADQILSLILQELDKVKELEEQDTIGYLVDKGWDYDTVVNKHTTNYDIDIAQAAHKNAIDQIRKLIGELTC